MTYAILGSCVSRDIFSVTGNDNLMASYRARTSLHALTANPVDANALPDLAMIESQFQRRMVLHDMVKTPLELENAELLVVDFIDERFRVLKFKGSVVTLSNALKSILESDETQRLAFQRGPGEIEMWRAACRQFKTMYPDVPVVLHQARYASHQISNGTLHLNNHQPHIERMNRNLAMYETVFLEEVHPRFQLSVEATHTISDPDHKWGLAPFHYIRSYYDEAISQLREFVRAVR